jgi:hypothetical protein
VPGGLNEAHALDGGYRTAHHGHEIAPPASSAMLAEQFACPAESVGALALTHIVPPLPLKGLEGPFLGFDRGPR